MKTYFQSKEDAHKARKWVVVDAANVPLGRLASEVACLIRGKHKPEFTHHVDGGDFVVVVNAEKIKLTGKKMDAKIYYSHSGYAGGLKETPVRRMLEKHPERVVQKAVKGMLPRGALGSQLLNKLKVYIGSEHPHDAQKPEVYQLKHVEHA
ncbi:50S ribosomal protein L13 [Oligoflexia bacterium]|nr:50S ribosomal protein L13 [Oligoflexia bacterium]